MQEVRYSRCGGDDGSNGEEKAARVCFEGGTDEEWIEIRDIRVLGCGGEEEGRSGQETADAAYWLAAGAKNADFSSAQAELLEELLEYR